MANEFLQSSGGVVGRGTAFSPRITANRKDLSNQFPTLGFTISAVGMPYYEVLLVTDPSLFAPANAIRRNASNFYSSRQDGGLLRADGTQAVYIAPSAVIQGFAQASPRPAAIYYTVIVYPSQDGQNGIIAQSPETLTNSAPSVAIRGDFRGSTLRSAMGVPISKLRPHIASSSSPLSSVQGLDASGDAAEGEDGVSAQSGARAVTSSTYSYYQSLDASFEDDAVTGPQDAYEIYRAGDSAPQAIPGGTPNHAASVSYDDGYDSDGYDDDAGYSDDAREFSVGAPAAGPHGNGLGNGFSGENGRGGHAPAPQSYSAAYAQYDDGYSSSPSASWRPSLYSGGLSLDESEPPALGSYEDDGSDADDIGEPVSMSAGYGGAYGDEADGWSDAQSRGRALDDAASAPRPLDITAKLAIIDKIAHFESGADRYSAINADTEFSNPKLRAYQKWHVGLSFGVIQFTQDSGALGKLLTMMRARDAETFNSIFGAASDELIRVTNAPGAGSETSPGGRSARVQPVDGADLWTDPWVSRFRQAGAVSAFQAAQNELAATMYIDPILSFARWLCLDTDRALTMVVDRSIQMGVSGAEHWIISAVGPIQTSAQRQQALSALGYADVQAFQNATTGLVSDGQWGPNTHAALTAALRALGSSSPISIPTREQELDALARAAAGEIFESRVTHLRQDGSFDDLPYLF